MDGNEGRRVTCRGSCGPALLCRLSPLPPARTAESRRSRALEEEAPISTTVRRLLRQRFHKSRCQKVTLSSLRCISDFIYPFILFVLNFKSFLLLFFPKSAPRGLFATHSLGSNYPPEKRSPHWRCILYPNHETSARNRLCLSGAGPGKPFPGHWGPAARWPSALQGQVSGGRSRHALSRSPEMISLLPNKARKNVSFNCPLIQTFWTPSCLQFERRSSCLVCRRMSLT